MALRYSTRSRRFFCVRYESGRMSKEANAAAREVSLTPPTIFLTMVTDSMSFFVFLGLWFAAGEG